MKQTARRHRNSFGEFVPMAENQVATVENHVAANADKQRQIVSSGENTTTFGTLVTMTRWQIAVTPNREQVCIWSFLMITKLLSMLSNASFWFCTLMFIKTLPTWNGAVRVFHGYIRRKDIISTGQALTDGDHMWEDLFPTPAVLEAYTLKLVVTDTAYVAAPVIYGYTMPLLINHPFFWGGVMALSFFNYHFLSFIHGCLQRASHMTKANARRRSS
jgi:hypothetical protein